MRRENQRLRPQRRWVQEMGLATEAEPQTMPLSDSEKELYSLRGEKTQALGQLRATW